MILACRLFRHAPCVAAKRIQDEFTDLPISRQRKYQLRRQRDSRCTQCGRPAGKGGRCLQHLVLGRERMRRKLGLKTRYRSLSYRIARARIKHFMYIAE